MSLWSVCVVTLPVDFHLLSGDVDVYDVCQGSEAQAPLTPLGQMIHLFASHGICCSENKLGAYCNSPPPKIVPASKGQALAETEIALPLARSWVHWRQASPRTFSCALFSVKLCGALSGASCATRQSEFLPNVAGRRGLWKL